MDNATMGSIEYAVEHLHVPLIVVLGHDDCGAVAAAVNGDTEPGHISYLVDAIKPAVDTAKGMQGDLLNNSINQNAKDVVAQLQSTHPILSEHVKEGKLLIVPARYHLDTGAVELLNNTSQPQNTSCEFAAMTAPQYCNNCASSGQFAACLAPSQQARAC